MEPELNNNILRFTEDKSFINWVNSGFSVDNDKWHPLQSDSQTQNDIAEAIELVELLKFDVAEISRSRKHNLLERINDTTQKTESPVKEINISRSNNSRSWTLGIAATFLLLVFAFWPSSSMMQIQTGLAEMETVSLPDNSEIFINAKSELEYSAVNYVDKRSIDLDGEAFFKVEKGKPFSVNTQIGKIEVLGTSFNVFSRKDKFEVVCETGKVRVSLNAKNNSVVLNPGEKCYLEHGQLTKVKRNKKSNQWIDGLFHYDGAMLKDVIAEMERQFDVKFDVSKINTKEKYSGFFSRHSLDNALESVFWTLNLNFERSEKDQVIVLNKKSMK